MDNTKKSFISLEEALKQGNSTANQRIKSQFISTHVYANVGVMVDYILHNHQEDRNAPFNIEDVENMYSYPEYRGQFAAFEGGTESDRQTEIERLNDLLEEFNSNEESTHDEVSLLEFEINSLEDLELELQEVYEWYIVSDFLIRKLDELGHPVLLDECIWGRCTTGQAILLDYAITQICAGMGILEGQENSWA
jgi:hypothetical protein